MKLKTLILTLLPILALWLTGCGHDSPSPSSGRALLVYMEANNNLTPYALRDINEMKQGMRGNSSGRLIVYLHQPSESPRLIEILSDGSERTLRTYSSDISSVTIQRMSQVMDDFHSLTSGSASHALVLWSHGTGWLADDGSIVDPDLDPEERSDRLAPLSFGWDGLTHPTKMRIPALAQALSGHSLDFIYFDCCHMATVETVYELRHMAPYIVASPTELGNDGMPYDKNIPLLLSDTPKLAEAATNTYQYYDNPLMYGCAITLISTDGLEKLASATRKVLSLPSPSGYTPIPYFRSAIIPTGIFDMRHYIHALTADRPDLQREWDAAYGKVIKLFLTTPTVYLLDASQFSGLGTNILTPSHPATEYGYDETAWYRDVVARH